MIKKKLSILLTLALASFLTTGCSLEDLIAKKEEIPTEQKEDSENNNENNGEDSQQPEENTEVRVKAVVLDEQETELEVGDTYQINASVYPNNASNKELLYSSQQPEKCSVSDTGLVTAHQAGDYLIKVSAADNEAIFEHFSVSIKEKQITPVTNYTVTFNANGGSGLMAQQTTNGSTYIVPSCSFSYDNHSFDKWALNSPTGTKYAVGSTIQNISANITLYATWVENTTPVTNYTVTFNANGGTGTMAAQQTNGDSFVVPACSFSYENHNFKNWAYESKNGVEYSPGETIKNIQKNITLYALWTEQQTIDPENPEIPAGYYSQCEGLTGSSLQAKLKSINAPVSPSYDWSRYEDADEALDDSSSILCVYTRHNIPKSNHCGNYAWDKWNREHVWTQSKYPASASDNHNIFACEGQINNYRGNLPYDEGGSVVTVFGHTTECKMISNTSFEPCDAAKGEIARAVMYGTVMYSYTMTEEIKSIELALKWHLEHPNTERDIRRNNVVYGNQGNRNPFVDHPEYACKIWGNTNSATKALCGGN